MKIKLSVSGEPISTSIEFHPSIQIYSSTCAVSYPSSFFVLFSALNLVSFKTPPLGHCRQGLRQREIFIATYKKFQY